MPVSFVNQGIRLQLKNKKEIKNWIYSYIKNNQKIPGEINLIYCSDDYILEINKKYLNHNYYTDIITFNYNEENIISGDLFMSSQRIKDNAGKYNETLKREILRVIAHGILHLFGLNDKTIGQQSLMRAEEEKFISSFPDVDII